MTDALNDTQKLALNELKEALAFWDEVKNSSRGAQKTVGPDANDWINRAARKVVLAFASGE